MDPKQNGGAQITPPTDAPQPPKSVLVIEFAAPGSAEFSIHSEQVTPAQILGAAAWLDWFARAQFSLKPPQSNSPIIVPGLSQARFSN